MERSFPARIGVPMPKWNHGAFDNELLAALVAVALAGFITLLLWVVFGPS